MLTDLKKERDRSITKVCQTATRVNLAEKQQQQLSTKMLLQLWQYLYDNFFRFWIKWIWRQVTVKCELQRIFDDSKPGALRTHRIEFSLECSKSKVLRRAVNVDVDDLDKCLTDIMNKKKIHVQKDPRFKPNLRVCLLQISGYKQLYRCVENLRKQPFDSNNEEHEEQLMELWSLLMPNQELKARISKQWGDIGFQGDDPKTDFRGMGMLGLVNLVYFSKHYTEESRQLLSRSNHPQMGYSYAIVGINLTEMAYSLLKSGALKSHLYNLVPGVPQLDHFHQLYCYLMYEFDKFWFQEEPESIMLFNQYREKFHSHVKGLLSDHNVVLTLKKANSL